MAVTTLSLPSDVTSVYWARRHVNLRFIDWIWHIRGRVTLGQSGDDAFVRLDPLLRHAGTSQERVGDTLTFCKKDPAAQDPLSVFDRGVLRIEPGTTGQVLAYHLTSRALLACFLAPLVFLAIAQGTIVLGRHQKPDAEVAGKTEKPGDAKPTVIPLNPIDKALGAPAPEKPGKDDKDKADKKGKKPSPTPAYVFAGLFAALYVVGRILEDRLVRTQFKRHLTDI